MVGRPTKSEFSGHGVPCPLNQLYTNEAILNLDDAVVLETFPNRMIAEMAAGLLESEGIEAMVLADDAGGAYPMLQFIRGVRLLVAPEDRYRAREILAAMAQGAEPENQP
jgi:hypothetical protein